MAGINGFQRFGRQYRLPLVVTTRQYEYDTLPEPLELENAVEILPLSPDVVELPEMRPEPYVRPPMHEQTFVPQVF